jgi:hypothetical protein
LTHWSGLEWNAEITEILPLNTGKSLTYDIKYKTVKELQIFGLWYVNDIEREYKVSITGE